MVTFWLLIDTIAMIGSPASRGAVPSVVCSGRAWRGAASAGGAAVSAVKAAVAASVTIAEGAQRRTISVDWAVVHRFVIPCPGCQGVVNSWSILSTAESVKDVAVRTFRLYPAQLGYASSFPILRVAHAPRGDERHILDRRSVLHAADLYLDTDARSQIPCREHRSISTSFRWQRIALHVSRPLRSRDRPRARGRSRRANSRRGMICQTRLSGRL